MTYSWTMSTIWEGRSGKTWSNELWVHTIRGRYGQSLQSWPDHGTLQPREVNVEGELEDEEHFNIVWEHFYSDIPQGGSGPTQHQMKLAAKSALEFAGSCLALHNSQFRLAEIRFQCNDERGLSVGGSNKFTPKVDSYGSSSSALSPNMAICVSTESQSPTRRGHGRFFLGGLAATTMDTNGMISPATQNSIATKSAKYIQDITNTDYLVPAVVRVSDRTYWDITGVRVGDEFDVQNRRRNARSEVYVSGEVT